MTMKIIKLTASNIKRLKAVEITPTGEVVEITGRNGQGKTSVLDSIWWALAGTANAQKQPIRKGEKKAHIKINMGDLIVERRFTETGSTLFVENKAGARYPSPQTMLDKLLGSLSFDPLAFSRMAPREQFDALRRIVQMNVDIDLLDGQNAADFGKRTDINRDAKALRARVEAIIVPEATPDAAVNENDLLGQMQGAGEENTAIEARRAAREKARVDIDSRRRIAASAEQEAEEMDRKAARLRAQAQAERESADETEKKLEAAGPLPPPVDVSAIRKRLEAAKSVNTNVAKREERARLAKEAERLEAAAAQLSEQIETRSKAKQDAIASAQMPVPGLGFGTGSVTFNEVPFEQASDAEKLKVSLAIAMASNPELRVIRIQDGSLLDASSLKQVAEMAKAHDYQIWIERVDDSGKIGIVIEDGAVIAVNEAQ